jgi:hypothetical protein
MRVLVACEFSGVVRRAFTDAGHDAWSCDLLPAEDSGPHIQGDARDVLHKDWDLMVAHPPCTRLCNAGVRWLNNPPKGRTVAEMWEELHGGTDLFSSMWNAPIPRICVENPVMHKYAKAWIDNYCEFAQSVQPWQFGDLETKRTCLWLKGLDPLVPSVAVKPDGVEARVHWMSPGPNRAKERSRFFPGISAAMASQWGIK